MDNKEEVVVEKAVEETTPVSSPQTEVPTTEEQTAPKQDDQPATEQVSNVESEEPKDPREYQNRRLAEENRRLKSERRQGSAFDAFRPQAQPSQVDVGNYTNEYGEVNWAGYNQAVNTHIQQVASVQADQAVQERLDENNARLKYPELFEDSETEQEIADRWVAAKLRGETVSISDIAKKINDRQSKGVSAAEKRGAEKILQEVTEKEQAGLSASGQTSQGMQSQIADEDQAVLEAQTRAGDEDAIVARLKSIPWANK